MVRHRTATQMPNALPLLVSSISCNSWRVFRFYVWHSSGVDLPPILWRETRPQQSSLWITACCCSSSSIADHKWRNKEEWLILYLSWSFVTFEAANKAVEKVNNVGTIWNIRRIFAVQGTYMSSANFCFTAVVSSKFLVMFNVDWMIMKHACSHLRYI